MIHPNYIPIKDFKVNEKKAADVKHLLQIHYGENWQEFPELQYFKNFFKEYDSNKSVCNEEEMCELGSEESQELMV